MYFDEDRSELSASRRSTTKSLVVTISRYLLEKLKRSAFATNIGIKFDIIY